MSLLNWFSGGKSPTEATEPSSGHSRADAPSSRSDAAPVSARRGERMARRELLYTVVRECMTRAGVLSSTYRFKVLSLDGWGRQFLVMVDLAAAKEEPVHRLQEIEALIGQAARARHEILVQAVYWRQHPVAQPPVLQERVAPVTAKVAPASPAPARADEPFEPINQQELAAFRNALTKGMHRPAAEQSYTLLTGFENTEMHDEPTRPRSLSSTQYGELN
ncbi:hypothetical protein [Ramlibacter algicola]|uniref:Uncharacterized protein n=1 Tax=Ramlibacter algicola TaxID=2795217 RepID=A0A934PYW8_9BURK|nr:hypothetical protein [Ramlibacter algicola]MBK0391341.1 hypothetical protein [Ramlibacter algicola]